MTRTSPGAFELPLTIDSLGHRGEGVARTARGAVYVPYTVSGDTVVARVEGDRGQLLEIVAASPDRVAPFCPYFAMCGGCAVQTLQFPAYAAWKRGIVTTALAQAGVEATVDDLVDAHGQGRRRATFHARSGSGGTQVGFMQARGHTIVDIEACPILAPAMADALPAARGIAKTLECMGKPLDILATATTTGLDVDVRGCGPLPAAEVRRLGELAGHFRLARLSNHGSLLLEIRPPIVAVGRAGVILPPGGFLQATEAGDEILSGLVAAGVGTARRIADLFCGIGTFGLRLAATADVHAVEANAAALQALARGAREATGLRRVTTEARDLVRRPLSAAECAGFEAIVFDPPRAGADAQARELARSGVPTVVAVSCNAGTFARDARTLVEAGYAAERITPVDQFRHSPHVEIVGVFRRDPPKAKRPRRLLG